MCSKSTQPYQPLVLWILHGVTGICAIAAILKVLTTQPGGNLKVLWNLQPKPLDFIES